MTHTPGPWTADADGWVGLNPPTIPNEPLAHSEQVVEYDGCGSHCAHWPNPDNLRLVLAAPELLEAAQAALPYLEAHSDYLSSHEARDDLIAAILKATTR